MNQSDEQLYELSAKELAESPRQGLLIKCMAKSEGDENKGKALYIETRVSEMEIEILEKQEKESLRKKEEALRAYKRTSKDTPTWVVWFALSALAFFVFVMLTSCGKQEVYEFEISTKHREFKHLDFNSTRWNAWIKENPDVPDYLTPMNDFHDSSAEYEVTNKTLIKFFPVDEDGFCFYQIESDYAEKKLSGEDAKIRREKITNIDFYDKHSNKLFSYPFDDSNASYKRLWVYEGKTSKVSRSLLERVDKEKTKLSIDFAILKKI